MAIKILLADDSLTIQKVVELTFSDAETRLMAVGSGDKAVQALDDFAPDIVLADVVMPGRTGYDVCEAVKQRPGGAFVPVVLLTGTFEPFDRARAERVGSDAIVTKPFDSHALQGLVRELVGKARAARDEAEAAAAMAPPPAPEPPPTMILSAGDLEEAFPRPDAPLQDTGATQALPALDLGEALAAPEPAPVLEDSNYSTRAMRIPTAEELVLAAEQEGVIPASPFEVAEAPAELPAPFLVEPAFVPPPPPPPPAFYEPEPIPEETSPSPFDTEPEPAAEVPSPFLVEPAFVPPPPPPPPAFYEPEPAFEPPPPPPPASWEPEPAVAASAAAPAFLEAAADQDTAPLPPIGVEAEPEVEPFFAEAAPGPEVEAAAEAPFEFEPGPEAALVPEEIEVEVEVEVEAEPAAGAGGIPVPGGEAGGEPISVAEAAPAEAEAVEPFPEMDQPVPGEEAAPWDEGAVEVPPPPPELVGGVPESEGAEPIPRDIEADLEAFEASGRVTRRPEIWERHAALIGEEPPTDIGLPESLPAEPVAEAEGGPSADELEEIAAAARLEDLSALIPPPSVSIAAPAGKEEAPPAITTAPIEAAVPGALSEADVDRIARRVVQLLTDKAVRDIAWEVVPEFAERLVRERIAEVERAG